MRGTEEIEGQRSQEGEGRCRETKKGSWRQAQEGHSWLV